MLNIELSTTMLIIISALILGLILACIVFIIIKDKKMDKAEINDLLDDLSKPRENLINAKIEVPIGENLPNKVVLKEEKLDLDSVLSKMQENLDKKEQVVENFETEQEEKSIISYQELIESMKNDNFKKDIIKYEEEQEKNSKEKVKEFLMSEDKKETKFLINDKEKKFQNTDFISPVFGKMDSTIEYPTVKLFENKKDTKIYKHAGSDNSEFLKSLKEFRSNL